MLTVSNADIQIEDYSIHKVVFDISQQ